MYEETLTGQSELRKDVQIDGFSLGVIAREIEEGEWELSVENAVGVRSVWVETFPTAQTALNAGVEAIKSEGIKSFTD
jgi:hypothetical protein